MADIKDETFLTIFKGIQHSVRLGDKSKGEKRKYECDWWQFGVLADRLDEIDSPLGFLAKYFRLEKFRFMSFTPNHACWRAIHSHLRQYHLEEHIKSNVNDTNSFTVTIFANLIKIELICNIGKFTLKADF